VIRHIVVFSVAQEAKHELRELIDELRSLPKAIEEIEALACSTPVNASEFDCVLTVDIADEEAFQAYRDHPAHQPALSRLRRVASRIVVVDIPV
jgi:hypothetical protein